MFYFSQLKKAQEKLIKDLEHCVTRREAIFTIAEARQNRSKATEHKIRINYTRKIDDIKNNIKQLETELNNVQDKTKTLLSQKQVIEEEIENCKRDIDFSEKYSETLREEIENRKTNRQHKFEILLLMQRKLNVYRELVAKKQPFLHTKRENMQTEYTFHKDMNNRLCSIVQNLISDFPIYKSEFTRLYNTLKLCIYTHYSSNLDIRMH